MCTNVEIQVQFSFIKNIYAPKNCHVLHHLRQDLATPWKSTLSRFVLKEILFQQATYDLFMTASLLNHSHFESACLCIYGLAPPSVSLSAFWHHICYNMPMSDVRLSVGLYPCLPGCTRHWRQKIGIETQGCWPLNSAPTAGSLQAGTRTLHTAQELEAPELFI